MLFNTASDNTKKVVDRTKYRLWSEQAKPINGNIVCYNVVGAASGCFQQFSSFSERDSVMRGQGFCTTYCPTRIQYVETIISYASQT